MLHSKHLYFLFGLLLACVARAATTYEFPLTEIKPNGIAQGWRDDSSWADVDVEFRADQVFEELKVQRVILTRIGSGRGQLAGPEFTVVKGRIYSVAVRMRSLAGAASVEFAIREQTAPHRDFAIRRTLETGAAWRTETFFFEGRKDAENYRIYLAFPKTGDVSIERISIREESREEFTSRTENQQHRGPHLHANPAFALGAVGWSTYAAIDRRTQYPLKTGLQYAIDPPALTNRITADGTSIGVLTLGDWNSNLLSDLVDIVPGQPVHALARIRRTQGSSPVQIKFFSPNWPQANSRSFNVGTEWTDFQLTGNPPFEADGQVRVELSVPGEGELEIAHLILTHHPDEALAASVPAFGAEPDREMTIYELGEAPSLRLHHVKGAAQSVTWQLVNVAGNPLREGTWQLAESSATHTLRDLPVGWYQLRWQAPWAETARSGVVNVAVVPPAARTAGDASPFGIHLEGSEVGVRKMKLLGAQWLRTNNPLWTKWTAVQPERDVWVYPDYFVDLFTDAGLGIVFNLDRTPRWAARNPDNYQPGTDYMDFKADLPANLDDWDEYVRRMVTRYRDKIQYWEVWNEPDIPFLRPAPGMTNAEAYYQLISRAAPIIRDLDPDGQVIMSPAYYLKKRSNPEGYQPDFTERFIEMGGMQFVDIYSIHFYLTVGQRIFDRPEAFAPLDKVRDAMTEAGRKPVLWNSEWGIINFTLPTHPVHLPSNNGVTPDQAARELVAWSVGQLAAGIEKLFWYDGHDNFYYHFHVTRNLFDYRQPKPAAVAYAVLSSRLDGLTFAAEEPVADNAGRVFRFANDQRQMRVAYAYDGRTFTLVPPAGATVTDHLGQPIALNPDGTVTVGEAPLYVGR